MNAVSLAEVLARPDIWRGDQLASAELPTVASGFAALDAELPGGGWARGNLTEVLADGAGQGECILLLPALSALQREGRWIILVAPPYALHAPAWVSAPTRPICAVTAPVITDCTAACACAWLPPPSSVAS